MTDRIMVPLDQLQEGEKGEIAEIKRGHGGKSKHHHAHHQQHHGKKHGLGRHLFKRKESHCCRMNDMGIRVGKSIELIRGSGHGPVLIKIDDSRIALGKKMAERIMVKSDMRPEPPIE